MFFQDQECSLLYSQAILQRPASTPCQLAYTAVAITSDPYPLAGKHRLQLRLVYAYEDQG